MKTLISLVTILLLVGCGSEFPESSLPQNEGGSQTKTSPNDAKYGNAVGNGGNVIVCKNQRPKLLDIWELEVLTHSSVSLGSSASYLERAKSGVERLAKLDPDRQKRYLQYIEQFESETVFLSGAELTRIPDALNVAVPKECQLRQLAIQQKQLTDRDPKYIVDQDLWHLLDADNKAALVLHETVYREAIEYRNHKDSSLVRKFVGYLASSKGFENYDSYSYEELLFNLQLPLWKHGVPVRPLSQENDGEFTSYAMVENGFNTMVGPNAVEVKSSVKFDKLGTIRGWSGFSSARQGTAPFLLKYGLISEVKYAAIEFFEDSSIKRVFLDNEIFEIMVGDKKTKFQSEVYFYPSGHIKCGRLKENAKLYNRKNELYDYTPYQRRENGTLTDLILHFNELGQVIGEEGFNSCKLDSSNP